MEHLANFLFGHWWMAFPILAMTGGLVRNVIRSSRMAERERRQHELELIRLQSPMAVVPPVATERVPGETPLVPPGTPLVVGGRQRR